MYKLFMALRYLRAHKIIYFSIVGVAVGIMTMVVVTSLMGGFSRDMRSRIRGMQTHIIVTSIDKNLWITNYDSISESIRKIPRVKGCAPRLEYEAWLGRGGSYSDVHIVGIVPEQERKVSELETFFTKGGKADFDFQPDSREPTQYPGVVVGSELRGSGHIGLVSARHATTPILCVKDFEVVGRFRSGMVEYDSNYVFMDILSAQQFLQIEDPPRANALAVAVEDYERDGKEVRQKIVEEFHKRRPCNNPEDHGPGIFGYRCGLYRTMTWEQSKRVLLQAVEVEKGMQYILLSLIVLVAGFNIIAIYTLVVRAKVRDIGILRALGATEGGVTSVFLLSGGLCGLFGSIFGIVLGLLLALNLNEIADFIRVVSREMNKMGLAAGGVPRMATILATAALSAALAEVVHTWLALYKERQPHPWGRIVGTAVTLGLAAWFSTKWIIGYQPHDHYDADIPESARPIFTAIIVGIWVLFCALWRYLDRFRRRPSWIFFGFTSTIFMSALFLAVGATLAIGIGILIRRPDLGWPGLELFSRQIYYLDRIPVYVDYGALVYIVCWTLLVSFICAIYPALRAAKANPVEAIRDE
jgi:lipoprotein-releasing system permease protein